MRNGENVAVASSEATPNIRNVPPRRTRVSPSSIAGTTPVASITTSHAERSSSSALVAAWVAPSDNARGSRSGFRSTTETEPAPAPAASWVRRRPIVPAP